MRAMERIRQIEKIKRKDIKKTKKEKRIFGRNKGANKTNR